MTFTHSCLLPGRKSLWKANGAGRPLAFCAETVLRVGGDGDVLFLADPGMNERRDAMAQTTEKKLMMEDIIKAVAEVQGAREKLGNVAEMSLNVPGFGKIVWRKVASVQVILEDLEGTINRLAGRVKY